MIHLVILLSILGAERGSSKPLPLSERQIVSIQNLFSLPERSRCIVTPEGACYLFGGYLP